MDDRAKHAGVARVVGKDNASNVCTVLLQRKGWLHEVGGLSFVGASKCTAKPIPLNLTINRPPSNGVNPCRMNPNIDLPWQGDCCGQPWDEAVKKQFLITLRYLVIFKIFMGSYREALVRHFCLPPPLCRKTLVVRHGSASCKMHSNYYNECIDCNL